MRRRLTVAILAVVVGTLVLTVAGSLFLIRRAAITTGETEITQEAQTVARLLSSGGLTYVSPGDAQGDLALLRGVGRYDYLHPVGLSAGGQFASLPAPLTLPVMDVPALQDDQTVAGNVRNVVFVAVPVALTARQRRNLGGIPRADLPVLIVTRTVQDPVNGLGYFLLVAGVVLLVGVAVAAVLARRISLPLVRAVETTRRIAAGDLTAQVPVNSNDDPELAELAEAINTMADSLSRSRGLERQFLLSVSHELRTPLTSIRGYADAVTDGTTDDITGALTIIGTESQRLERLVEDLLDLARLDARQFSFHLQPTDMTSVVSSVADGFRPQAHELHLELMTDMAPRPTTWVDADPDRLAQIVANLVENAFKFATSQVVIGTGPPPGSPGPRDPAASEPSALWVMDDGPGIASADLERVFERHFTSDRRSSRPVGSGLGLAIVAELAVAMGGSAEAQSPVTSEGGTRMVVWIPSRGVPTTSTATPAP